MADSVSRRSRIRWDIRVAAALRRVRGDLALVVLDVLSVSAAYTGVLVMRFDGAVPADQWDRFQAFLVVAVLAHLGTGWTWGLYRQMWRHASVAEARRVLLAGTSAGVLLLMLHVLGQLVPLSVVTFGAAGTTMLLGAIRFHARLFAFRRVRQDGFGLRVGIVGGGDAGAAIVREMLRQPETGLRPVAVFDDDPRLHGLALGGVPVVGAVDRLPSVAAEVGLHQVVLAIPSADRELVRRVVDLAAEADLAVKILPRVDELLGAPSVRDVRDLQIEDLLGRQQVETDLAAVRRLLAGRRVLITGGGGSIGTEIARQVADCHPAELMLLDHDETHLHDAAQVVGRPAALLLADIRDTERLHRVFHQWRPEIVFHAAAHKHVPMLEDNPGEAVSTNIVGTRNVIRAAADIGVDRLVLISTDKAVRPSSVMGASKWLCEQLLLADAPQGSAWCAVRFGNVLGSRGSVIPTFARQIAAGGPVTVTDPRMTRFFMSVQEAVQLVLQAAVFARGREVFMLDMGEPVNILDLAQRMIRLSGRTVGADVGIRIVGERAGEKLVEELTAPDETVEPTDHAAIVRLEPQRFDRETLQGVVSRLEALARDERHDELRAVIVGASTAPAVDLPLLEESQSWSRSST